ncbi:hypothetical protein L1987_15394 [Smallanthus sonchifolius]|uniref:Uncharacterized protein n=1 Tax=Smallanthus sonchifolius TaxID=185202 RepID=A0ACB9J5Y8_9ASTR|nr:hypothetical protein L1987_15394 [Smallanthus sonchifolius]
MDLHASPPELIGFPDSFLYAGSIALKSPKFVYVLETITSYRYAWTSVLAAELATLAFYVFTGYSFRPKAHNPYFAIDDEEEEAAVEALKLKMSLSYEVEFMVVVLLVIRI